MSYKSVAIQRVIKDVKDSEDKRKGQEDFVYFCQHYLPHVFRKPFAEFQLEIVRYLQDNEMKRVVIAAPREHGKTSLVFLGYVLWSALYNKHKYILVIASSEEQAKEQLFNIKLEIENNHRIAEDFGELKTEVWSSNRLQLANGTYIVARGAGSSIRGLVKRGLRPDLIILDDIEKDIHKESATMRKKLKEWFYKAVMGISKDAKVFVIGTILHYDSLLNELIEKGQELGWFAKKYKAVEDGKPLHPYLWSLEELERKRQEIGSIAFASEYLNEPISAEDKIFKEEWISYYDEKPELDKLDICVGVDPATGKAHGDYTAVVVVGKDKRTGVIYTLYTYNKHASPTELIDTLVDIYRQFRPRLILFEEVAFQEVYKKYILQEASRQSIHLPVKGIKPRGNKEIRAQKIAPLIENGLLKFKKEHKELVQQLKEFPLSAHDDLVDALVYAVEGLEKGESPFKFLKVRWL